MKQKRERVGDDSPVFPIFPVHAKVDQVSRQYGDCARDGEAEVFAPRREGLPVLFAVTRKREVSRAEQRQEMCTDSQMEVLHIVLATNELAREGKRVCWRFRSLHGIPEFHSSRG